ncbi:MAG: hypothetical protein QM770_03765 [Tepidisphaeraceae bacterium]
MPEEAAIPSETAVAVDSPPLAARPSNAELAADPRSELLRLASMLRSSRSTLLLTQYLRLRRAARA